MKKKWLIVNADDLGMSKEISDGILTSHLEGIVTSASLMANMPDSIRSARLAQQITSLDVGVHLNITDGYPVLPAKKVATLVSSSGEFLSERKMLEKIKKFRVNPYEIEAEFSAQINEILSMGISPSHLDSHHHVHIYPITAYVFRNVAKKFYIKKIRATRFYVLYRPYFNHINKKLRFYKKMALVKSKNIYKIFIHEFLWYGMLSPTYAITTSLLWPEPDPLDFKTKWINMLNHLPNGICEADCHPGYKRKESPDYWSERTEEELKALTSVEIKEAIEKLNIKLINFDSLK